jgi:hypothetical protein
MARRKFMQEPDPIELWDIGKQGVVQDVKPHNLPPEAITDALNVRFGDNGPQRFPGHVDAFGTLTVDPEFIMNVPTVAANYWIYCSLDKAYVWDGVNHSNITRQAAAVDVDYTPLQGYLWQGTILGGVPVLNNGADLPQYWPTMSPATKLANLINWPTTLRAKIIKAFGPYLVAFNLVDNGVSLPKTFRWSSFCDPGTVPDSWDITDATKDAGQLQLTDDKGGQIQDALLLGNQGIIYTEASTHLVRYVGGIDILATDLLLKDSGILSTHCVTGYNKGVGHFVVSQDDMLVHQGTKQAESVVSKRLRRKIFNEMDTANYAASFCVEDTENKEVWFVYPTAGNERPDKMLVWNYRDNTCTFRDAPFNTADFGATYDAATQTWEDMNSSWATGDGAWDVASRNNLILANAADRKAYAMNKVGPYGSNSAVTSYFERIGLAIDGKARDGSPRSSIQSRKLCKRIWPKITGTEPVQIQMGSQQMLEGPLSWSSPKTFDPQTQKYLDFDIEGLLLAYRVTHVGANPWQCEGLDFEIVRTASGI